MKQYFKLDLDVMIETIIYITNWLSVFKCNQHEYIYIVMYLSDKLHLEKYGRFIYGESYQKLIHGPIPVVLNNYVSNFIIPLREPNLKFLSESDIICLDETIIKSKTLELSKLKELCYDDAYYKTNFNEIIDIKDIVLSLHDGKELLEYLEEYYCF